MASNTKQTILVAYFTLITQKNIDKVTVKDVVEECGITRQTFYYHFQDLLDVIEWGFRQKIEECVHLGLSTSSMEEALRIFLTAVDKHRIFARRILKSKKKQQVFDLVIIAIQDWLFGMFHEKRFNEDYPVHEIDFAMHFYAYAISGSLYDIVWNDKPDLDFMVRQITSLMQPVFSHIEE
jgi:AcrR family transcriptional regulator